MIRNIIQVNSNNNLAELNNNFLVLIKMNHFVVYYNAPLFEFVIARKKIV